MPFDHDGRCDKCRGVGSHDDADEQGECKVADYFSAQKNEGEDNQHGGARGEYRAVETLVDGAVDYAAKGIAAVQFDVFSDAVIDHNCIVEGVPHNGEQSRHNGQGDLPIHN